MSFVKMNGHVQTHKNRPLGYNIRSNGCWEWTGATNALGYGVWVVGGRRMRVHRLMYERHNGAIPDGLCLDHLCRNRKCCNPDHLEAVTPGENVRRGLVLRPAPTHCKHGHPFDAANTYHEPRGGRTCRECRRRIDRERNRTPARIETVKRAAKRYRQRKAQQP